VLFVWLTQNKVLFQGFVVIIETECVYCTVRIESLTIIHVNISP